MSLVAVTDQEWRKRKINLMEVFRSFISQLRPGQELTKVSLPSVLCHPYSMLEVIAYRKIVTFHELFSAMDEPDALKRFLSMIAFYFTIPRTETYEKKPYNPVVGENHFCWVKNEGEDDYTEFMSEQVSHHPPVSAYYIQNKTRGFRMVGNLVFRVSFGSNYVSVNTSGYEKIFFGNETYEISKCIPDMVIRNVVWGKKYIMWIGNMEIQCPDTGYIANIELSEKSKKNIFKGTIRHRDSDEIIYELDGICSDILYYYPPGEEDDKKVLIDMSSTEEKEVYYQQEDQLQELSSLSVWKNVNEAIVDNDMKKADSEKKNIEKEQRRRIASKKENGTEDTAEYFEKNPDDQHWYFKDNISFENFRNQ
jgi:hypothetical protein